jgi:putative ABC transport system permease protein
MLDIFFLSIRNLSRRKTRSYLTMIGIIIGIAAVVSLIGLGEGLKTAINAQFGISSTEVLTVQAGGLSAAGPPGTGVVNPLTFDDSKAIEKLSTVQISIPRILESSQIEFKDKATIGFIMSIPEKDKRKFGYEIMDIEAEKGRLLKDGDTNKVVLGYNYFAGTIFDGREVQVGDKITINNKKFDVVGITEKKGSFIFDNIVHLNEDIFVDFLGTEDRIDILGVKVKDKKDIDKAKLDIEKLMRDRRNVKVGEEDFMVQTPGSMLEDVNSILTGIQVFIVIIACISILVGAIGIINTMFTSVTERKKEIGIMKSVGAKNNHIFFLFLFESGLLGFLGGLIGTIIGALISYYGTVGINTWVNSTATPELNLYLIFGALFGSFIIGSLSGVIPAMNASRLKPVETLRG